MGSGNSSSSFGMNTSQGSQNSQSEEKSSSSSVTTSEAYTLESDLSKEQLKILKSREEVFETDFLPNWQGSFESLRLKANQAKRDIAETDKYNKNLFQSNLDILDNALREVTDNTPVMRAAMALQSGEINSAYNAAQKQTAQRLAQQNLLGQSNGVSAALQAQNDRARSSALSEAYYNILLQSDAQNNAIKQNLLGLRTDAVNSGIAANQETLNAKLAVTNAEAAQKNQMLNILGALVPQPTQASPFHNYSHSETRSSSSSTANSTSKGNSSSFGANRSSSKSFSVG